MARLSLAGMQLGLPVASLNRREKGALALERGDP